MRYLSVFTMFLVITVTNSFAQDFGITYTNYTNEQILRSGNIETAFTITNYGPAALVSGDKIYVAAKINGTLYKLDLTAAGPDVITLTQDLPVNGTISKNPGYLNGILTLAYLNANSVDICMLVYGKDAASVGANFPSDPNPSNNSVCVTYTNAVATGNVNASLKTFDVNVFPNPAINEINFRFSSIESLESITLTDLSGKKVKEISIDNAVETMYMHGVSTGMYFYTIKSKNGIVDAGRIIIQE